MGGGQDSIHPGLDGLPGLPGGSGGEGSPGVGGTGSLPNISGSVTFGADTIVPLTELSAATISSSAGVSTGSVLLATFTQGSATQTAGAYTALVDWGDGSLDISTESSSPPSIVVSGQTISVYGSHTYFVNQTFNLTVTLFTDETEATANPTINLEGAAPSITSDPTDQAVMPGQTATFTASASGEPTSTVQWQVSKKGGPFRNIRGATSSTLTLTNVTTAMNGYEYQAVFTNKYGNATTSAASLSVITLSPPALPDGTVGTAYNQTITASGGNGELNVNYNVTSTITPDDLGLTFTLNNNQLLITGTPTTSGTIDFDVTATEGGVIVAVQPQAGIAEDQEGNSVTKIYSLAVNGSLQITQNPADQVTPQGKTATFTAAANGTPTPTVQWQVSTDGGNSFHPVSSGGNTLIQTRTTNGTTTTRLKLLNVTSSESGNQYLAVFSNAGAQAASPLPSQNSPSLLRQQLRNSQHLGRN